MIHAQAVDCWRYHPEAVLMQDVIAPPSGQLTSEQVERCYHRHPLNSIRMTQGRKGDAFNSTSGNSRGSRMAAHLSAWRSNNSLYHDKHAVYLIEQAFTVGAAQVTRRGIILRVVMQDLGSEDILFADGTTDPLVLENELTRLRALQGQMEVAPALICAEAAELHHLLQDLVHWEPTVEVTGEDQVTTRLWIVDKGEAMAGVIHAMSQARLLLLEGKARVEAAIHYRDEVRAAQHGAGIVPPELGALPSDSLLVACFPVGDPGVMLPPGHPALGLGDAFNLGELPTCKAPPSALNHEYFPDIPSGLLFHLFY